MANRGGRLTCSRSFCSDISMPAPACGEHLVSFNLRSGPPFADRAYRGKGYHFLLRVVLFDTPHSSRHKMRRPRHASTSRSHSTQVTCPLVSYQHPVVRVDMSQMRLVIPSFAGSVRPSLCHCGKMRRTTLIWIRCASFNNLICRKPDIYAAVRKASGT